MYPDEMRSLFYGSRSPALVPHVWFLCFIIFGWISGLSSPVGKSNSGTPNGISSNMGSQWKYFVMISVPVEVKLCSMVHHLCCIYFVAAVITIVLVFGCCCQCHAPDPVRENHHSAEDAERAEQDADRSATGQLLVGVRCHSHLTVWPVFL